MGRYEKIGTARNGIVSAARNPIGQAAVGMASVLFAGSAAAQEATLPTIDVQGDTGGGYQAPVNAGVARVPTPLRDTPQTVNVVTDQVLKEQSSATVKDALRNVSGITFRAGEGGNQGDTPYIRGFSAQSDIFRDSVRDPGWYTRDAFNLDAVEVYKGPSSFLFGRGSTGGVINLVSKTAKDRDFGEAMVTGNTGPGARATLDVNKVINPNVSARIVVMGQGYDTPDRNNVEENRMGIAPSLKFKISDYTTATLSYLYQRERSVPDYGIPYQRSFGSGQRFVVPVSRNTWYGILSQPYPDTIQDDIHAATAKIEHNFNANLKVTNTTRYTDVTHFQRNVFPEPNGSVPLAPNFNTPWTPNRAQVAAHNTLAINQTDLLTKFNTGFLEHTLAAGFDISQESRDFTRNSFAGQGTVVDLFNPDSGRASGFPQAPTFSQLTQGNATDVGAFVADQVKLNKYFEVLGGLRYEQYRFDQKAPMAPAPLNDMSRSDNLLSWRIGAVFHPTEWSSIYIVRGTSFNPSSDNMSISVANAASAISQFALEPEKNETTEVGVKADVLNGRLSLAASVFNTEKTNMRVTDPVTSVTSLLGSVSAPGVDASIVGKVTDKWQMIASYTYVHARTDQTSIAAQLNKAPLNTPDHSFSLWNTYDLTDRWQIGGGAFYASQSYGDVTNTAVVPEYWRFDAMMAYKVTPKSTLQLNIYNLTDKLYYATAYSNWAVPAPGRTVALTYRYSW